VQSRLVAVEEHKVIHVADVEFDPHLVFDVVIQFIQVKIRRPLREQAADGHVLRIRIALVSGIEDDLPDQVQRVPAFDLSLDDFHQDVVIDGRKELGYIAL